MQLHQVTVVVVLLLLVTLPKVVVKANLNHLLTAEEANMVAPFKPNTYVFQ